MRRFLALVAVLFAPVVAARSVDVCPSLPPESGLEWSYHEGPDFDVCTAAKPGSERSAFGIYLGNHPSFHPQRGDCLGRGRVANRRVVWYRKDAANGGPALARQTLLVLNRRQGYVAHVWVGADSEEQLLERLSVLEKIAFRGVP